MDSSIITAISTLLAVGITLFFTTKREKSKFIQDLKLKEYKDIETFCIDLIAFIEKTKKYTERGEDYKELFDENFTISAKANFIVPNNINEQIGVVSEVLYEWSTYYRKSLPTTFGNTGLGVISSTDKKYRDKADEIYPTLNDEIWKLIEMLKNELSVKKELMKK